MCAALDPVISKLYNFQPTLNFLEDVLHENHIYCSSPGKFNDLWDCKPYFDPQSISDPKEYQQWVDFFLRENSKCTPDEQSQMLNDFGPEWYSNTELIQQSILQLTQGIWRNNIDIYRIFCFTTCPTSPVMWAHYGNQHTGICLEFDATTEKVKDARPVRYKAERVRLTASIMKDEHSLLEEALLTKFDEWSYEKEYRLLGRYGAIDPTFSLATEADFLKLPPDAITSVIVGYKADINRVREIINRVAPGLSIKRIQPQPHMFELTMIDDDY